ncbi:MAG: hypothetical protein UT58_C0019G0001, partial [Microgenomates group bacterium GW2011_GWC1_39_7b]
EISDGEKALTDLQKIDLVRQVDRAETRVKVDIKAIVGAPFHADLLLPLVLRLKHLEMFGLGLGLGCGDLPARFAENGFLLGTGIKVRDEAAILREREERAKMREVNSP